MTPNEATLAMVARFEETQKLLKELAEGNSLIEVEFNKNEEVLNHYRLACVIKSMLNDDVDQDEARLIAAAPELLWALETIVNSGTWYISALEIDFPYDLDGPALEELARNVIAKAKGEAQ